MSVLNIILFRRFTNNGHHFAVSTFFLQFLVNTTEAALLKSIPLRTKSWVTWGNLNRSILHHLLIWQLLLVTHLYQKILFLNNKHIFIICSSYWDLKEAKLYKHKSSQLVLRTAAWLVTFEIELATIPSFLLIWCRPIFKKYPTSPKYQSGVLASQICPHTIGWCHLCL